MFYDLSLEMSLQASSNEESQHMCFKTFNRVLQAMLQIRRVIGIIE